MNPMHTLGFTYWKDGEMWLGYLDEFPDYLTQGQSLDELKENLVDLRQELTSGAIPCVRHRADLEFA